jgi:hypothetical protein
MGISRMTLLNYERLRSDEWVEFISLVKTALTSAKKQLAFRQKIPTVLAIFDLCNNSNYVNSSEFKLEAQGVSEQPKQLTASQLPRLDTIEMSEQDETPHAAKILTGSDLPKL